MKRDKRVRGVLPFTVMLLLLVGMVVDATTATGCETVFKALYVLSALLSLLISGWALHNRLQQMERPISISRHSMEREVSPSWSRCDLTQHWSFWVMVAGGFLTSVFLIFSTHHCPYW